MRFTFPELETISPYLFGNKDYDLRDSSIRQTVRDLSMSQPEFFFRAVLGNDFYKDFHVNWFNFSFQHPRTLLLAPRDSLKCLHSSTLVANPKGCQYAPEIKAGSFLTSVFKNPVSEVNHVGSKLIKDSLKIYLDEPFNFWIRVSMEHKFFAFDIYTDKFFQVTACNLDKSRHLVLLCRPPVFYPDLILSAYEIRKAVDKSFNLGFLTNEILQSDINTFRRIIRRILKKFTWEKIRSDSPFIYNSIRVLQFFHGLNDFNNDSIKLLLKSHCRRFGNLNRDKIAFILDQETDYRPLPLQVNDNFSYFTKIDKIEKIASNYAIEFYDFNVSNSHYIANGFVTHNSSFRTVGAVLYSALRDPERRYAIVSSTGKLATGYVKKIKRTCERNQVIRYCFNDVVNPREMSTWTNEALEFMRTSIFPEPTIWALGVGTDFTGFHFEEAFFDDLVTIRHRRSATLRQQAWDWFRLTALPALDKKHGRGHVTGTRYHWDDMYGKLYEIAETSETWKISRTPALDEHLLSQNVYKSFWPERFSEEDLRQIRTDYGEETFQLQYQCAAGIALADKHFLNKIRDSIVPVSVTDKVIDIVLGSDLASRGGSNSQIPIAKKASFSLVALGRHSETNKFIVLECIKIKKPSIGAKREWIKVLHLKWNPLIVAIEQQSQQSDFMDYLGEGDFPISIKPVKSFESKEARFEYILGLIASGSLFFIEESCQPLIEEMYIFPDCTADAIDALFFALRVAYHEPDIKFM